MLSLFMLHMRSFSRPYMDSTSVNTILSAYVFTFFCTTSIYFFSGNMGHARGAAAVRAAKKEGINVAIGVLAIQLGMFLCWIIRTFLLRVSAPTRCVLFHRYLLFVLIDCSTCCSVPFSTVPRPIGRCGHYFPRVRSLRHAEQAIPECRPVGQSHQHRQQQGPHPSEDYTLPICAPPGDAGSDRRCDRALHAERQQPHRSATHVVPVGPSRRVGRFCAAE